MLIFNRCDRVLDSSKRACEGGKAGKSYIESAESVTIGHILQSQCNKSLHIIQSKCNVLLHIVQTYGTMHNYWV